MEGIIDAAAFFKSVREALEAMPNVSEELSDYLRTFVIALEDCSKEYEIPDDIVTKEGGRPMPALPDELAEAVELLGEEYAKAQNKANVTDPICYALYHAWRRMDSARRRKIRS